MSFFVHSNIYIIYIICFLIIEIYNTEIFNNSENFKFWKKIFYLDLLAFIIFRLAKVNQEKAVLLEENESEREFSMLTKARYDELKTKFDQ